MSNEWLQVEPHEDRPYVPFFRRVWVRITLVVVVVVGVAVIIGAIVNANNQSYAIQVTSISWNYSAAKVDVNVTNTGGESGVAYCTVTMPGATEHDFTTSILNPNQVGSYTFTMYDENENPGISATVANCLPQPTP